MKKLNKKLALAVLSLGFATLTPGAASADSYVPRNNDPCNPCNPCVDPCRTDCRTNDCCSFDFFADFIYWKPCVDDLDFAAVRSGVANDFDNPQELRYKSICPDWEPGFRLGIRKEDAWKCFDLDFEYTWLDVSDSQHTHAGNGEDILAVGLHPTIVNNFTGLFDSARGKYSLNYQTFEILFAYPFRCGSCHTIAPFFGVEIAKFDQSFDVRYEFTPASGTTNIATIDWDSNYRGAGLELGTDYKFLLCEGFSLFARATGTILIGDANTTNDQADYDVSSTGVKSNEYYTNFKDGDCCHVVPGIHLQLGFQYEDESCGCEYKLRVGYEMLNWWNLQNPRRWFTDDYPANFAQSTHSNTTTLGFHGLLVGFEVKY